MSEIDVLKDLYHRHRDRTLGLLARIETEPDAEALLGWQPGPGRAHIGWQLMHVAICEELAATERLTPGTKAAWPDLAERFRAGSRPDDHVPTARQIREVMAASREHLYGAMSRANLDEIPPSLKERGWTVRDLLTTYLWHEAHHQGQAHLTYNLYKARS